MFSEYVEGYTSEGKFCPFCGERVYYWKNDGSNICENEECEKRFYVIEVIKEEE